MEIGSDEDNQITSGGTGKKKTDNGNDALAKPKRKMKTPFQLETLENVYAVDMYPSEATRAELSEKLGLTDRQLQMWFCHRRLKDKKDVSSKKQRKPAAIEPPVDEFPVGSVPELDSGYGPGRSPYSDSQKNFTSNSSSSGAGLGDYETIERRNYEPRTSMAERRAIACIEAQLGEPLRKEGPILGTDFDLLPPGAFGAPIDMQNHSVHPYDSKMYESRDAKPIRQSLDRQREIYGRYAETHVHGMEYDMASARSSLMLHGNGLVPRAHGIHGNVTCNRSTSRQVKLSPFISSAIEADDDDDDDGDDDDDARLEQDSFDDGTEDPYSVVRRKGKIDDVRESGRKEFERLEILRKKNEERMRKEMERHKRERRKEEERLVRERQREEERSQREQKREMERRERFLQKEFEREEKKRQKEEIRREKEAIRCKIAIEKATARRIAKESMDLIEDELLELMELAAASKGLPSILQLDHDTLGNLEIFRDSLSTFPPTSVQLKRPFAISPWKDAEEIVGNLLMVWRFLMSFSDFLGLWPFTLDEFIQAFHDHDSRLLGEMHIALLRSIIRDIEDVARTPFAGSGVHQYTAANPEGGHPQLVEGAYAWGFDIRSWQKHLSPLTWPEILRQLALSAGFGPKLKKKGSGITYSGDKVEVKACEDVISTIRSGSAAQTAFALMREKNLLLPRKSRHRLTPGTVKFAAFHVLSLEGSKGMTVLKLADKIQKSGLRDLSTSKTPEASISVALTRDVKLFERIAPSTYCVRAPYRKDPADAEAILAEARKKIRAFENGVTGAEDVEDVERDEESEGDVDEDPLIDDFKSAHELGDAENVLSDNGKENIICDVKEDVKNKIEKDLSSLTSKNTKNNIAAPPLDDDFEVDETNRAQSWVQSLTERQYCYLSVEERLNALVALISIANEGNSIRAVLEDRMEAANSVKKQMWAEAQLDKNCMRDIIKLTLDVPVEITLVGQDINTSQDNNSSQHGYASKRSRSQLKSYIGQRAEEMYVYRSLPLGQDRRRNRYWQFTASASRYDPCSGLIFVELHDGKWRLIDTQEAFDALVTSLDTRGTRESHLLIMLRKIETSFKENVCHNFRNHHMTKKGVENEDEMITSGENLRSSSGAFCGSRSEPVETSNSFKVEFGRNDTEKTNLLKRYKDCQRWMWSESFNSLAACASKYGIINSAALKLFDAKNSSLSDPSLPPGVRILKAVLSFLEASVLDEAFESYWTEEQRNSWVVKLNASSSPEELIEVLTMLENAVKRKYVSSDYVMTKEHLGAVAASGDLVPVLPWIPCTLSAVALRLSELDASIQYVKQEEPRLTLEEEDAETMRLVGNSDFKSNIVDVDCTTMKGDVLVGSGKRGHKRGGVSGDRGSKRKIKRKKIGVVSNKSKIEWRNPRSNSLQFSHEGRGRERTDIRTERGIDDDDDDDDCLENRMPDFVRPKTEEDEEEEEEETYRDMDEDWMMETPSRMMMPQRGDDDDDDDDDDNDNESMEGIESDDNVHPVEDEADDGIERVGKEAVNLADDTQMCENSYYNDDDDDDDDDDGEPNDTVKDFNRESEDYSSDIWKGR